MLRPPNTCSGGAGATPWLVTLNWSGSSSPAAGQAVREGDAQAAKPGAATGMPPGADCPPRRPARVRQARKADQGGAGQPRDGPARAAAAGPHPVQGDVEVLDLHGPQLLAGLARITTLPRRLAASWVRNGKPAMVTCGPAGKPRPPRLRGDPALRTYHRDPVSERAGQPASATTTAATATTITPPLWPGGGGPWHAPATRRLRLPGLKRSQNQLSCPVTTRSGSPARGRDAVPTATGTR